MPILTAYHPQMIEAMFYPYFTKNMGYIGKYPNIIVENIFILNKYAILRSISLGRDDVDYSYVISRFNSSMTVL